jgi:Mrp family chromosome partitioning ATPase
VDDPVEVLSSQKMKDLISEMKNRYEDRYIIIDTPPLLSFAETHSLCQSAAGVVLVVRQDMTPALSIRDSLEVLKDSNLFGVLFNSASQLSSGDRYGYGAYSRYAKLLGQ